MHILHNISEEVELENLCLLLNLKITESIDTSFSVR